MLNQIELNNTNKKLNIKIYPSEGKMIELGENDIVNSKSVSISYKCGSDSDFAFASVYSAECTFSFRTEIDRYALYDARVEVFCSNGTEHVRKGVYHISEAIRQNRYVSIKAYDDMLLLDEDVDEAITGTVYEILSHISNRFGIELGMQESDVNELPNAGYIYSVSQDIIDTWRDVLHYLAAVTCTFAVFDGDGKLRLCRYHEETDKEFDKNDRSNPSISDYEVSYDGIRARFIQNGVYKEYSVSETEVPGRFYDAGDIPIVRLTEEQQQQIILNMLVEVLKIKYVPVSMKIRFNPFLELGDKIAIRSAGQTGDSVYSYVMNLKWSFRGLTQIKSVGNNPKLSGVKDKSEKRLSNLEGSISAKDVVVHSYTNIKKYIVSETEIEVININYSAVEDTNPIFVATVPVTLDLDGNVIIRYYLDGVLNIDDTLIKYFPRGQHFVTISNNFKISANERKTLAVTICTQSFESDTRKQEAKIASIIKYIESGKYQEQSANKNVPKVQIEKYGIKAVLFAQGLAGTKSWDGTIYFDESFDYISLFNMNMKKFGAEIDVQAALPKKNELSEAFGAITLGMMEMDGFSYEFSGRKIVKNAVIDTAKKASYVFDRTYVEAESDFRQRTSYRHTGGYTGNIASVTVDNTGFETVTEVKAE